MNQNQNLNPQRSSTNSTGAGATQAVATTAASYGRDLTKNIQEQGKELLTKFQEVAGPTGEKLKAGGEATVTWVKANPIKSICIAFAASLFLGKVIFGGARSAERKYLN